MTLAPQHDGSVAGAAEFGCVCFGLVLVVVNARVLSFSSSVQFAGVCVNLVASGSFFLGFYLLSLEPTDDLYAVYGR